MRKLASASLLAVALLLIFAAPSLAWERHHFHGGPRVFVGVGVGGPFWWGYPYYGYPYYYPPPYAYAPPVVVQEPPVYVQQPGAAAAPPAPSVSSSAEVYWYYCPTARDYYPRVLNCPEAWIKVPPRQE
jgi:hypothetical protein